MNLGRNAVAPSDFTLRPSLQDGNYIRSSRFETGHGLRNEQPSIPSYDPPTVGVVVSQAASTSSSSVVTALVAVGVLIVATGCIVGIVVVVQRGNQSSSDVTTSEPDIPVDEQYSCSGSTTIINKIKVCDGTSDCPGGTDEDRCIISVNADDGGDVEVYSVSTNSYHKICGYEDGWTNEKSDHVCEELGFQSSSSSVEFTDGDSGVSSNGSFSLNAMVQQAPATCTNNKVMRITCLTSTTCGRITRSSRIVGGEDGNIQDYPWQVSLQINGFSFCGGSIIGDKWVLTAAHCVDGLTSLSNFHIVAGITSLTEALDSSTEYDVQTIIMHPLYNPSTYAWDVALIKVTSNFELSSTIKNVCLPPPGRIYLNLATVTASGWGTLSSGGSLPTTLQAVNVMLYNTNECPGASNYPQSMILPGMVCAGVDGGGKDSCQGDSGGPLTITIDEVTYLVGATSWGISCAANRYPGVYAEISYARSWVIRNMS